MVRGAFLAGLAVAALTPALSLAQNINRYPYNYGFTQGHYPYYYSTIYPGNETSVHYQPRYHTVYYPGLGYSLRYDATGSSSPLWAGYQSFSPSSQVAPPASPDNTVTLEVRLPDPTAEVWIDGQPTTQKGMVRQYVTPTLTPGRRYRYELKAEWVQNGRKVQQTQAVTMEAGQRLAIDFLPTTASR